MKAQAFDGISKDLGQVSTRRSMTRLLGGVAALGTVGLVGRGEVDAKKKKKKKNKQTPPPPPPGDICPTGRTRLSNGTCATICAVPGQFVAGGCQCTAGPNTEGQNLLTPSVAVAQCSSLTQVCNSTAECPVGQMCLTTGCGGANPKRCHAVCA